MEEMVTARDFRLKFKEICDKVLKGSSLIVVRRSKPIFRVEPLVKDQNDLLNRAAADSQEGPSLEEVNDIVHTIRKKIK